MIRHAALPTTADTASLSPPSLCPQMTLQHVCYLGIALLLSWLPVLLGSGVIGEVAGLYVLSTSSQAYFQPTHGWLLYIITPLVVTSSFCLYLSPGMLLVLALGRVHSTVEWGVLAFGTSLLLSIALSTGAKLALGMPLTSLVGVSLWCGMAGLTWLLVALRLRRQGDKPWPIAAWPDVRRCLWIVGIPLLAVSVLLPKLFWENFNVDGIEAFEYGRSLTTHLLPYWELQDGVFGFYQNFMLFAYLNHWFITLFGPYEAAARLPFVLSLTMLFCTLVLLIEWARERRLSGLEETVVWLGLALYTVVQVYNTNYEPFFADIAEMAATDSLQVVLFLATCYALWARQPQWLWIFGLMTYCATPGGLLLLGALAVATVTSRDPGRWEQLWLLGSVILTCLCLWLAYEILYNPLVTDSVNNQFSAKNILRRLYPPTVTEVVRFNVLLFPSGILPALALLVVRRKDQISWGIAGVTIVYFGVLYLQAWTAVHQFTPIMVLPLVVFWRLYGAVPRRIQRWLLPAVAVTTALSLVLSCPRHFQINQAIRQFGQATAYRVGDYEHAYEHAVRAGWSLYALLPRHYRLLYPEQPWGTDPLSWIYYATRAKSPGTMINYVVQPVSDPVPAKATQVIARDGVAVYVRDLDVWQRDREQLLPRVVVSPLYEPVLRRTAQFFRAYAERMQPKVLEERR